LKQLKLFGKQFILTCLLSACSLLANAQTVLTANGTTDTYTLINSVLAPGYTAMETPDSFHPAFGPHITQVYDATLGKSVFKFWIHVSETNELQDISTGSTDRQRNEVKTYEPSPSNMKGTYGETVVYKWRFQLPVGFQPSSSFTHIHQIKAVGGDDSSPLFTLTPRKGSTNKMQLIHNNTNNVAEVNLSLFEGVWVEATETIRYDSIAGTYSMVIKKVSDNSTILSYSNGSLMTFRGANYTLGYTANTFIRPKWGIYRSVANLSDLRDEAMLFDSFSIEEITNQAQTITFASLPASFYGDANFSPGATASSGMPVTYSSSNTSVATIVDDSIHIVGVGTSNITASQAGDATYASASSVQTLTVSKADQTIAFAALTKAVGDADFSPATASSDLTVTYSSSNTSVATIVGGKIHVVAAGTSNITASQAGNSLYNAASDVVQTLTVTTSALYVYSPTSTTVLFGTLSSGTYSSLVSNNSSYYKINSTTSGTRKTDWYGSVTIAEPKSSIAKLIVNYDGKNSASKTQVLYLYNFTTVAWVQIDSRTVSTSDVSITNEQASPSDYISAGGEIRLRVYTSGGTSNYSNSGDYVQFTLQNLTKSDQTISFEAIPEKAYGVSDFSPGATASSSLTVSYASSNPSVATIVSGNVHVVGVGASTITASQAGDAYTNAAADVSQTLTVTKGNQTISFGALPTKYTTDSDFDPGVTVSSGLGVSYASSNTAVATILSGKVHLVGAGTTTITASQAGDVNYNAATNATQTLDVVANTGLFNETFNYTDGSLSTQGGYTEAGTYVGGTGRTIGGTALTYADAGGSYVLSGSGKKMTANIGTSATDYYDYKAFKATPVSSGIVYLSFLLKANANISSTNQEVMGLANGTSAGPKVLMGKTTSGYFKIGTVRGSTTSVDYKYATTPTSLTVGTTYLVVLKYDFSTSTSSVYINPTLDGTEPASPEISDNTSATFRTQLNNLWFRAQGTLIQNYDLSSARVSTSWGDAVAKYVAPTADPIIITALREPTTGTATDVTSSGFRARWTNNDLNAIGYTVKVYWGTTFVDSAYVSGLSSTSLALTGLVPGLTYTYKVSAVGNGTNHTNSPFSTESTSFTLLTASIPSNNLKIILKLDDLGVLNSVFAASASWDYMKANNIKWGAGCVGNRLDGTSSGVLSTYLNATNSVGDTLVEVWNHGLQHVTNEFSGTTYAVQKSNFDQATLAVKNYLGIQMHSFGTPYNASDATTNTVISEDPNYKVFMFSDLISATNGVTYLDHRVNMESATGSPVYSYFVDNYNAAKSGYTDYMVLQGHPNYYTAGSSTLDQFKLIIQFLLAEGCEFVRPYDYYRSLTLTAPSNLGVSSVSASQVNLTWTDNTASETNYKIERSTDNANWTLVGTTARNSTSYSDNTVVSGNTYYYRIYANCGIKSGYSSVVQATYLASSANVSALSNVTAASNLTVAAGNTLTIDQNTTLNKLTAAPGAKVTLSSTKTLSASAFTLESDASGTATFVDENTIDASVTASVQQYLTSGRNWYMSIPVSSAGFSSFSSADSVARYYEPLATWFKLSTDSMLYPMRGYISATTHATGAIAFNGSLNSGEKFIDLTRTVGKRKAGFNLVGNPYPSYVSWDAATKTNLEQTIWFRTRNALNSAYIFDTYNATSHVGTSLNGSTVTTYIPPMQAFWVLVAEGNATGRLTFNNSMRSHSSGTNRLKSMVVGEQKVLHLQVSNGTNVDEAIILFNPLASDFLDDFDSQKMTNANNAVPEMYSMIGNKELVINGLNSNSLTSEIALGFRTGLQNQFTIRASEIKDFDADTQIFLKDKLLNTEFDLSDGKPYTLRSDSLTTNTRFSIQFKVPTVVSGTENNTSIFLGTNANHQIVVNNPVNIRGDLSVYTSLGQLLESIKLSGNAVTTNARFKSGLYLVGITIQNKTSIQKVIVN